MPDLKDDAGMVRLVNGSIIKCYILTRFLLLESPPPTPTLSPTKASGQLPNTTQKLNAPDTPSQRGSNSNYHRKTGRPPARRGRLGRNQYTRDQPLIGGGMGAETPLRDNSRDPTGRSSPTHGMNGATNGINGESGRSSRPKYHHPNRTSMKSSAIM